MLKSHVHLFHFIFQPHSEKQFHKREWRTQTSKTCPGFHGEKANPDLKLCLSSSPCPLPPCLCCARGAIHSHLAALSSGCWPSLAIWKHQQKRGELRTVGVCSHCPHTPTISLAAATIPLDQGSPSPKTTPVSRLFPPLVPSGLG